MKQYNVAARACDDYAIEEIGRSEGVESVFKVAAINHRVACEGQFGKSAPMGTHLAAHSARVKLPDAKRSWGEAKAFKSMPLPPAIKKGLGAPPEGEGKAPAALALMSKYQGAEGGAEDGGGGGGGADDDEWDD